ncbi:phosphatidylcholine-sterol acyltransferase-like isoform X2 [Pseudochaenichthys georgianus]|uniref:phosphatidylcholine-sterol acyltransferase-like isoform X2 n=1 Tax=Pseudochaenichthys georgianus TaxID=52239 RepID=UPI001469FB19|nr:phosphatidylcholine-sterol acyltransferase-like isoform X2 [Pseudochaenichthys georgianus]
MGPAARLCSGLLLVFLLGLHHSSGFWIINVVFPPNAKSIIPSNSTPPLIIVPGNLGNRLEGKIDKPTLVHWMCYKKTEHWFPLWIDLNMFMPVGVDCWIDNIRLVYNKTTRQSSNSPGVQVRVPGFGQTYPIEFIDYNRLAGYFHTMVQHLVNVGYTRNETVRGAPYDWRLAPRENDGIPMISILKIREEQRMKPTNPWMLPTKAWPSDHVFISTPTMNYTNQDYQRLFTDINYEDGWHMWEDTKNLTGDLYPPGVEVWCMYGVGLPTPVTYIYDEEFPNKDPVDFVYADGDDTVDSFSMSLCKQWAEQQEQPVHVTEYRGLPHLDIVFHEKVITQVQQIMEGQSDVPKEIDVRYGAE